MSYDFHLYILKPGVDAVAVKAEIRKRWELLEEDFEEECGHGCGCGHDHEDEHDHHAHADEEVTEDEDEELGEDLPLLRDAHLRVDYPVADFLSRIARPYLSAVVPEDERTPALAGYLASKGSASLPRDVASDFGDYFDELEENYDGGVATISCPFEGIDENLPRLAPFFRQVIADDLIAFDPQTGTILEKDTVEEALKDATDLGMNAFGMMMRELAGDDEAAIEYIDIVEEHVKTASVCEEEGDIAGALHELEAAWQAQPEPRNEALTAATLQSLMGYMHFRSERLEEAEKCFRTALTCTGSEDDAAGHLGLAACLMNLGREEEGADLLAETLEEFGEEVFEGWDPALLAIAKGGLDALEEEE